MNSDKLIFVYNANSGVINGLLDFAHKLISPQTYACSLCRVTYGNTGMKGQWREYVNSLPYQVEFLHRDELTQKYPELSAIELPAGLVLNGKQKTPHVIISATEFNAQRDVTSLINLINQKLAQL